MANFVKEARRKVERYLVTYPMLLMPRSPDRNDLLTSDYHRGMSPFWFFGATTSIAAAGYSELARYKIEDIALKPRWWQAPFEVEFFGVNLKNACVEFMNAVIVAAVAMVLIRLMKQRIGYRRCLSAFLYAYAIAILIDTGINFVSNAFWTAPEYVMPTTRQWLFEGGRTANLTTNLSTPAFTGDRLFVAVPTYLTNLFNDGAVYFVPKIVSLFNATGFYFSGFSAWHETVLVIAIADLKVVLAAYILRLKIWVGVIIVVACSFIGFYVDAVASRYTAKHVQLGYFSTRMHPSVQIGQAFKYSTTYFDNFPMKTGDLALVDFWQCKWSRHPSNKYFVDGSSYKSETSLHFDFTFTECNEAIPSVATFLVPEYEIVRVVATAGQRVDVNLKGEIVVNGQPIAERKFEDEAEFKVPVPKRSEAASTEPNATGRVEWVDVPVKGKHLGYEFKRTKLPHEPDLAAYLWACTECSDEKLTEDDFTVPKGYFLAMFDFVARPRLMLIREGDVLGYPFLKAKKRW